MAALTAGLSRPGVTVDLGPGGPPAARTTGPAGEDRSAVVSSGTRSVRSWPLLVLAAPAAAEVWTGWVGIAQKTGFGLVSPLPGTRAADLGHRYPYAHCARAVRRLRVLTDRSDVLGPFHSGEWQRSGEPTAEHDSSIS